MHSPNQDGMKQRFILILIWSWLNEETSIHTSKFDFSFSIHFLFNFDRMKNMFGVNRVILCFHNISMGAWQNDMNVHVILPGTHCCARHMHWGLDTYFNLSSIFITYMFYLSKFHTKQEFGLQISYPAILFTMLLGILNCGSFIVRALLPGTSTAFTLPVFLLGARIHVLLPGIQRYILTYFTGSILDLDSFTAPMISWAMPHKLALV